MLSNVAYEQGIQPNQLIRDVTLLQVNKSFNK